MPEQINTVKQSKIQVAAREAERLRIAQDLHDAFGGNLTGASMLLAKIASQFSHPSGEQADTLAQLRTLLADSRRKLQQVIYDLRPPEMASGLIPALRQLCSQWQACSGLECDLLLANINDEKNVDDDLHAEHMLAMYRITQEALNNVARHAHASLATVLLQRTDTGILLKITDNGPIGENKRLPKAGAGLIGIGERVSAMHGSFTREILPHGGTCLCINIPLDNNANSIANSTSDAN